MTEETANQWNYGLNVLPPIAWTSHQGMEVFMVSEAIIDDVFTQHAAAKHPDYPNGVRYFRKNARLNDRDTWISEDEVNRYVTGTDTNTRHKTTELIIFDAIRAAIGDGKDDEDVAEAVATALYVSCKLKDS